jgi:hypothetical protein
LKNQIVKKIIFLFVFSICLFIFQQWSAKIGERYKLPIINNIVLRILPNKNYVQWFKDNGMPYPEQLNNYKKLKHWKDIYPVYSDPKLENFRSWVNKYGKEKFSSFLLENPRFAFELLFNIDFAQKNVVYNLEYIGENPKKSLFVERIFPVVSWPLTFFLLVINAFLFIKNKCFICSIPLISFFLFGFNAALIYLADSLEIERHLYMSCIILQFINILSLIVIIDHLILIKSKRAVKGGCN